MRRVPITLRWKVKWWLERSEPEGFAGAHTEGARAYAARQADLFERLATHFEEMWAGLAEMEVAPGEAEQRAEELMARGGDDDEEQEDDDDATGDVEGEDRMEGDEEGSVGGDDDEPEGDE
ncbi:hypothetical protein B0H19DRAFT_1055606 [Mycena capillaripes]|nr:hypothetical protein B0H19DRAFT_1055606 [Mycena capillaripes]